MESLLTLTKSVFSRRANSRVRDPRCATMRVHAMTFEGLERRELMAGLEGTVEPPALTINDGLDLTNLRSVEVSFDNVDTNAQSMRFAYNGFNFGNWQAFVPVANVTIPNYQGTNWVNAEIQFSDGSKRIVYDSIVYKNPTLVVNNAASRTNTREVTLSFADVAADAVGVELAYNGFNYQEPVGFSPTMTVTLPNYQGNNFVNSRIVYAGQKTRFVWDSIDYKPATVEINADADWTNVREVTLSFKDVTSDAEQVTFAFNGTTYGKPVAFEPTMSVTLPNWQGANFTNARIHYSDGREAWLWDSIDYVPLVKSCSECVAFQMDIQDEKGEGFRDPLLSNRSISAFNHALGIWSASLHASYDGETITVEASMDPASTFEDGVLAEAGPAGFHPIGGKFYAAALYNHEQFADHHEGAEIVTRFNSGISWHYGLDAKPNGKEDFVTTVLHETGHGLNLIDSVLYGITLEDGTRIPDGSWNFLVSGKPVPGIYDSFLVIADGTSVATMSDAERASAVTSNGLFWGGINAISAHDGQRPQIHAPKQYKQGSSVGHLDEGTHGAELMSPFSSGPDHSVGDIALGMLLDMGWTLA